MPGDRVALIGYRLARRLKPGRFLRQHGRVESGYEGCHCGMEQRPQDAQPLARS
jgi:hypothetical protein